MKNFILSLVVMVGVVAKAHAGETLASAVISFDAPVKEEIVKLYNSELGRTSSKVNTYLSQVSGEILRAQLDDLVLIKSTKLGQNDIKLYVLTTNANIDSTKTAVKRISVLYSSDMGEEEMGLSTKIYLNTLD